MFKQLMVKQLAQVEVISLAVSGIAGVTLALNGYSYWALAIQSVIYISLASILRCVVSPWRPTLNICFDPLKKMLPFSIKLFITGIFVQINTHIFSVVLGKLYNATQLGFYSQGQKWMGMGQSFIGGMINYVSQPVLVQIQGDKERQVVVLRKLIRFGAFISFPLMLGLAFIGKEFILITIGSRWLPSVLFLQLFCIWGAVGYLWALYTNLVFTHGKSNTYMYIMMGTGLLQLGAVAGMSFYGLYPMVIGYILMYFAGLLVWQHYVHKLIGLRLREVLKDILPYLLITFICFFITWILTLPVQNPYLLCLSKVALSAALYILIMRFSHSTIFRESMEFLHSIRS
jgi:O-antigen/teichoic acid export membrane protein